MTKEEFLTILRTRLDVYENGWLLNKKEFREVCELLPELKNKEPIGDCGRAKSLWSISLSEMPGLIEKLEEMK